MSTTITHARDSSPERVSRHRHLTTSERWTEGAAFWLLIGLIAWAPFPLGSNRPWSWSLLTALVACAWIIWSFSVWQTSENLRPLRRMAVPLTLSGLTLLWAV